MAEPGGETALTTPSRYAVLASAIALRSLQVESTQTGPTYTDGRTIFIAVATDPGDVRDAVVMQAALLAGGSLEKRLMAELARRRHTIAQRYLALEIGRVARQLDRLLPGRTLRRVESSGLQPVSINSEQSLSCALSHQHIPPPPRWAGTLQPSRLRRVDPADLSASPTDADLEHFGELREEPSQSDDNTEESKILKLFSAPVKPNAMSDAIARFLGMGPGKSDKDSGSGEIPVAKQTFGPVGRNARKGRLSGMLSAVLEPAPKSGIRYPEWDCYKGAYRSDWCTVAEYSPAVVETTSEHIVISGPPLTRPLARVGESNRSGIASSSTVIHWISRAWWITKPIVGVASFLSQISTRADDLPGVTFRCWSCSTALARPRRLPAVMLFSTKNADWRATSLQHLNSSATASGLTASTHRARTRSDSCESRNSTRDSTPQLSGACGRSNRPALPASVRRSAMRLMFWSRRRLPKTWF